MNFEEVRKIVINKSARVKKRSWQQQNGWVVSALCAANRFVAATRGSVPRSSFGVDMAGVELGDVMLPLPKLLEIEIKGGRLLRVAKAQLRRLDPESADLCPRTRCP